MNVRHGRVNKSLRARDAIASTSSRLEPSLSVRPYRAARHIDDEIPVVLHVRIGAGIARRAAFPNERPIGVEGDEVAFSCIRTSTAADPVVPAAHSAAP